MGVEYLSALNPEKLSVEFLKYTTPLCPLVPRRYTLTHSDSTGELYLDIGSEYVWSKINPLRDEVLGEWKQYGPLLYFEVFLYLDQGEIPLPSAMKRSEVFRRELPLAIDAIRYGDHLFFETYSFLNQVPIVVNFISSYPQLAKREFWGNFQKASVKT